MQINCQKILRYFYLAILSIQGSSITLLAQSLKYQSNLFKTTDWSFEENKGQVENQDIKYYGHQGGVCLYCKPGRISFVFTKTENGYKISEATGTSEEESTLSPFGGGRGRKNPQESAMPLKITTTRADLILLNSNYSAQIIASDQQEYYENYYTTPNKSPNKSGQAGQAGDANHGITNVHTYNTITYQNIYPHIDMVLHSKANGMKYEFVVHPGGKVSDIQMQWNGMENMQLNEKGGISYAMNNGKMEESRPVSFQGIDCVQSSFVVNHRNIGFKVRNYSVLKILIIDPDLDWGTYYATGSYNSGNSIATDASGNVYITGVYMNTSTGKGNNYLAKFKSDGTKVWGLYYGFTSNYGSYGNAVTVDISGNIFMTGSTQSYSGVATSGAYQTSCGSGNNGYDAFLSKFDTKGDLIWGTYFGGAGFDIGSGICCDKAGSIYITGTTNSYTGVSTNGAYQTYLGGGSSSGNDAFIAKFSGNGAIVWATYYGGGDNEQGTGIAIDPSNNLYITGLTQSKSGIATNGAYLTSFSGNYDMFLAKFDSSGAIGWATYYGGAGYDAAEGIAVDRSANIYIAGYTQSVSGIAISGAFQTKHSSNSNSNDACLIKFDSAGALKWGTYYGNAGTEEAYGVACDDSDNIYIDGAATYSPFIATPDAYQKFCSGGQDIFLAKFNGSGKRVYGTFYGGAYQDEGCGIVVDHSDNVYITGITSSSSGIATLGAYQTALNGYNNAFLTKFKFQVNNDAGIVSIPKPKTVCPGKYPMKVTLKNFGREDIKSVEIHWAINYISQKINYWTGDLKPGTSTLVFIDSFDLRPGTDTIQSWTEYPNGITDSLIYNDSTTVIDSIFPVPTANVGTKASACYGIELTLGAPPVKGNQYAWSSIPVGFSSTLSYPEITSYQLSTTTYILKETNPTGCSTTDSVKITVHPLPVANPGSDATICSGKGYTLGAASDSGSTYYWKSNPAKYTYSVSDPVVYPSENTLYYITETNIYGCPKTDSVMVTVNPVPVANAGGNSTVCSGTGAHLGTLMYVGDNYQWKSKPAGLSSQSPELWVYPDTSTRYILSVSNKFGCVSFDSVFVNVNKMPKAITGHDTTICDGNADSLGTIPASGSNYYWYNSTQSLVWTTSSIIVSPDQNTVYYLIENIAATGCTKMDSVVVNVLRSPATIHAGTDQSICLGTKISLGMTALNGCSYSWTSIPPGYISSSSDTSFIPKQTATYILNETAYKGCSKKDSVTISVHPDAVANAGSDSMICQGSGVVIGSPKIAGSYYAWTSSPKGYSSTLANPTVSPNIITLYRLKVTTAYGCTANDSITVKVLPSPVANPGSNQTVCAGTIVSIGAPPVSGNTYKWVSFPMGFASTASDTMVKPDSTTSYILYTSVSSGCSRRAYITITVNQLPGVRWNNIARCDTITFLPQKTNNKDYSWYFGDGDSDKSELFPVHEYKSLGNYQVRLVTTDSNGCRGYIDSLINIDCLNPQYQDSAFHLVFYPNPFHGSATLEYLLNKTSHVSIGLYDAIGRQVSAIEDNTLDKGVYSIEINSEELHLGHGVYFLIFRSDNANASIKIVSF